ncbi:class I SAM-dependent methyltransferase [Achromobacter denitrificans]|uniref:class I SAM-dependent methyltransferase n=1 Tax=Achromobacter denitrificans TaxID=32002 RepID=UPI0029AE0AEE|nr:class I SAM-dependent methyltransferase [Achromobacter sp.]
MQPKINSYLRDKEEMKPVPVSSPSDNRLAFALRCLLDLQLKSIVDFLRPKLSVLKGNVLDVGAGNAPWKSYLPAGVQYIGLDVDKAGEFNMRPDADIVYYPGGRFPFDDETFTNALCIEVLEHVPDTETLLAEIYRCLQPGGQMLMTVPWSARRHHIPHDYFRFTPEALAMLLCKQGLEDIQISERGNDYSVIFNKILCVGKGLVLPKNKAWLPLTLPMALLVLPSAGLFLIAAHVSMRFGLGSHIDPLGYAVTATKPLTPTPQTPTAKEHY